MADRGARSASPTPTTSPPSGTSSSWSARSRCARRGLMNVLVTNGSVNPEPFAELLPLTSTP